LRMNGGLLLAIIYFEVIVLMVLVLAICLRVLWRRRKQALGRERLARAFAVFNGRPGENTPAAEDTSWLARLPVKARLSLLINASPALAGAKRVRINDLAREVGVIEWAEKRCRNRLWPKRLQGVRALTALGGGASVVPALLRDRRPEVRAQAIQWASDCGGPEIGTQLIDLLGDEMRFPRFTVQNALLRIGAPAIAPLAGYLLNGGGAGLEPALEVAAAMPDVAFLEPARKLSHHDSPAVRRHCARILGALGGNDSVARLSDLLNDEDEEVRAAAAEGLGTLGHWPAASQLALALRDRSWTVRRAAGLALRSLGSPGMVLLRRSTSDPDRFAADMSRQVLDLPDTVKFAGR